MSSVRSISNRGTFKVTGKFPSIKTGSSIAWESTLEQDFCYLLEADPSVLHYESQPLKLSYWVDGKRRHYTPDFKVTRKNAAKCEYVEVKNERAAKKSDFLRKINLLKYEFFQKGDTFYVVTEKSIRSQPRLDNIQLLYRYARHHVTTKEIEACLSVFGRSNPCQFGFLMSYIEPQGIQVSSVFNMMFHGILEFNCDLPINSELLLRRTS